MNKKHKLLHRNNEYITSKLEIIYEEDIQRIVEEKNNLQSKIDNVNDVLSQYMPNYASCVKALDEIEFILKEDK